MKATKLPSGNYRTQVVVGVNEKGKRIVKSFTAVTEWESLKLAAEFMEDNAIGIDYKNMTVYQAFTQYINSRSNILSPSTIRGYRNIQQYRLQVIMDIKINNLRINDVQRAVNFDAARLGRKSIKSALSLLKSVLELQDITINMKKITIPKDRPKSVELPPVDKLFKVIIGSELELPCMLAAWLSLRVSEVRGLKFSDISNDGKYITVRRAKICLDNRDVVREQNKTVESTRTIPLPPYLYNMIKKVPHNTEDDYIVPLRYEYIRKHFKKLMEDNGFSITFHKLRHEFATVLNDLGIPDEYIQKLGGWSSDIIMKSVYTHTTSHKEIEYQRIIDGYFNGIINKESEK